MSQKYCLAPGCDSPPFARGRKVYDYCKLHMQQQWREQSGPGLVERPGNVTTMRVVYAYLGTPADEIRILEAHVVETKPMPATEGELRRFLAECEQQGDLIVWPEIPLYLRGEVEP